MVDDDIVVVAGIEILHMIDGVRGCGEDRSTFGRCNIDAGVEFSCTGEGRDKVPSLEAQGAYAHYALGVSGISISLNSLSISFTKSPYDTYRANDYLTMTYQ